MVVTLFRTKGRLWPAYATAYSGSSDQAVWNNVTMFRKSGVLVKNPNPSHSTGKAYRCRRWHASPALWNRSSTPMLAEPKRTNTCPAKDVVLLFQTQRPP